MTRPDATARVETPDARTVTVIRSFAATPAQVWRAYTEPALLQRWLLGPPGWTMPVCEMDLRVGGSYHWRWQEVDGPGEFGFRGTFRAIEPGRHLSHTEQFDPGSVGGSMGGQAGVTVDFAAIGSATLITTTITYASTEDRDAAVGSGMTDGMEMSYALLDGILAQDVAV